MTPCTHRPLGALALLFALAGCTPATVVPSGGTGAATSAQVTGTVTYRERMALPASAEVIVQLVDVSRADAASIKLAEQRIPTAGRQVPFEFALAYDPARIEQRNTYAVQVRIEADGKLLFISDTRHEVLTHGAPARVDIVVRRT